MPELTLVIGTRNYSSWSLRPWLLLRHLGLRFAERLYHFDTPEFATEVPRLSPTRRVPVLLDGSLQIWESLAICEYASELAGGAGWPDDPVQRATARALSAEMHAGFAALRAACPMNARATARRVPMTEELRADLWRIDTLWSACRREHAGAGPWLFGGFSIADAMYAPVVLRCRTYGLPLGELAQQYADTVLQDAALGEWVRAAVLEPVTLAREEVGLAAGS